MIKRVFGSVSRRLGNVRRRIGDTLRSRATVMVDMGGGLKVPVRDGLIDPSFIPRTSSPMSSASNAAPSRAAQSNLKYRRAEQTHLVFPETSSTTIGDGVEQLGLGFAPSGPAPSTHIPGSSRVNVRRGKGRLRRPRKRDGSTSADTGQKKGPSKPNLGTALARDWQDFRGIGKAVREARKAGASRGEAFWGALGDYYSGAGLADADVVPAMIRRGVGTAVGGLVGIGIGTRALDAAFGNKRRY